MSVISEQNILCVRMWYIHIKLAYKISHFVICQSFIILYKFRPLNIYNSSKRRNSWISQTCVGDMSVWNIWIMILSCDCISLYKIYIDLCWLGLLKCVNGMIMYYLKLDMSALVTWSWNKLYCTANKWNIRDIDSALRLITLLWKLI